MKAKKIHEVLNFEDDIDPYKALSIGSHQDLRIGDKYILMRALIFNYAVQKYMPVPREEMSGLNYNMILAEGSIHKIEKIKDKDVVISNVAGLMEYMSIKNIKRYFKIVNA